MQIRVHGEMTIAEMRQAIFETLAEIEDEFAIRHARSAVLFFTPTDGLGETVTARNPLGKVVEKVTKQGPYRPAADKYVP